MNIKAIAAILRKTITMETAEYSLTVPVDLVTKTKGLALDIGLSDGSVVYRSKENLDEAESQTSSVEGHLQLVTFPKSKLTEVLEYIKHRSTITRNGVEEQPDIFASGIGCTQLRKAISESLSVRVNGLKECDCIVKAFIHLASQLNRTDFVEPCDDDAIRNARAETISAMASFSYMQKHGLTEGFNEMNCDVDDLLSFNAANENNCHSAGPLAICEDIYPCILIVFGREILYIQVNSDKSFKMIDTSKRGCSFLLGMGTVLTGCKNFNEFLDLASRGDPRHVDIYSNDLSTSDEVVDGEDSVYTKWAEIQIPSLAFCFGKGVGAKKEDMRPEDLAVSWLTYVALDITQCLTLLSQIQGIKRLFFCGSLCNSSIVRSILTKEMTKRIALLNALNPDKMTGLQFDFVKPGSHLGALGALIIELEKLTGESSNKI